MPDLRQALMDKSQTRGGLAPGLTQIGQTSYYLSKASFRCHVTACYILPLLPAYKSRLPHTQRSYIYISRTRLKSGFMYRVKAIGCVGQMRSVTGRRGDKLACADPVFVSQVPWPVALGDPNLTFPRELVVDTRRFREAGSAIKVLTLLLPSARWVLLGVR